MAHASPDAHSGLPDDLIFPILIAAKAAWLNPPPCRGIAHSQHPSLDKSLPSADEVPGCNWWYRDGERWITHLCEQLQVDFESLPPCPTVLDVHRLKDIFLSRNMHRPVAMLLLRLSIVHVEDRQPAAIEYSASFRALVDHTLVLLFIPPTALLDAERIVADELFAQLNNTDEEMKQRSETLRKEKEEGWGGKWGRWGATAGGVLLGGLAIGLTSGLAVPVLVPFLPFLTSVTAPVVLGSLFGIAGGGLTGYRVRRRWAGVEQFDFVEISASQGSSAPSLTATILIPGILVESETEALNSFKACIPLFSNPPRDVYVLSHSPKVMLATGKTLHDWMLSQVLGRVKMEIIKRTALSAVMAAVALPMTIYATTGMLVDNEWERACDKARKAGILLADVLRSKVQGERPIVLVGSSLGALVLLHALLDLANEPAASRSSADGVNSSPLVDTAIFISSPISPSPAEWAAVRGVVSRRVVNGFCTTDLVLAGVGRLHEVIGGVHFREMAGLGAVDVPGVENVDLSNVMEGHFDLAQKMGAILQTTRAPL